MPENFRQHDTDRALAVSTGNMEARQGPLQLWQSTFYGLHVLQAEFDAETLQPVKVIEAVCVVHRLGDRRLPGKNAQDL